MSLPPVLWMILAGHWGWCLRTLHIKRTAPPPPPPPPPPRRDAEMGRELNSEIDALRFDMAMIGAGFICTRNLVVESPDKPTVFIVLSSKKIASFRTEPA